MSTGFVTQAEMTSRSGAKARHGASALRPPTIGSGCGPRRASVLRRGYRDAFEMAVAAAHMVNGLPSDARERAAAWDAGPLRTAFGAHVTQYARRVARVYAGVLQRFISGWPGGAASRAIVLDCFPDGNRRCAKGLLGNASVPGRLRFCPQLLARSRGEIASVVLHELLHRGLGVKDQQHESCDADRKNRCYRDSGVALARRGRSDLAVTNIDNYVFFARLAVTARGRGRSVAA